MDPLQSEDPRSETPWSRTLVWDALVWDSLVWNPLVGDPLVWDPLVWDPCLELRVGKIPENNPLVPASKIDDFQGFSLINSPFFRQSLSPECPQYF